MARARSRSDVDRVLAFMDSVAGGARVLSDYARRIEGARESYRDLHAGARGRIEPMHTTIPDVEEGPVVILGQLYAVEYLSRKGTADLQIFHHNFDRPLPLLAVAPDGNRSGLVIARGRSHYTVNRRGIVG